MKYVIDHIYQINGTDGFTRYGLCDGTPGILRYLQSNVPRQKGFPLPTGILTAGFLTDDTKDLGHKDLHPELFI